MERSEPTVESVEPAGRGPYVVRAGDCIESIAYKHGHYWKTLWDDPRNEELKQARENPNILLPGDRVSIPRRRRKDDYRAVDQRHRFRRRGVPSRLRLRLMADDIPRANLHFSLDVDGVVTEGQTDAEGRIDVPIPPDAQMARLHVDDDGIGAPTEYELQLGYVVPAGDLLGVQQRLGNLGWACPTDGGMGPETEAALAEFQRNYELEETGQPDDATLAKLEELHGS